MKTSRRSGMAVLGALVLVMTAAGASAQQGPKVAGTWNLALEGEYSSRTWTATIAGAPGAMTAKLDMGEWGNADLQNVTLDGNVLRGDFTANMHGQEMKIGVSFVFDGDTCTGGLEGFPMGAITWVGTRAAP